MGTSEEELVERFLAAIVALDVDSARELIAEGYVGSGTPDMAIAGSQRSYHGPEGLRQWITETGEILGENPIVVTRVRSSGPHVLLVGTYRTSARPPDPATPFSAIDEPTPFACLVRIEDGKIRSIHAYPNVDAALADGALPPELST